MHSWRVLITPASSAFFNMAVDEAILHSVIAEKSPPTLRFYTWSPPAVSIGYFQDLYSEINLDSCRRMGIDVVRRITGGRAVLHDQELTYSITCHEAHACFPPNILDTYRVISSCLVRGLNRIGLRAALTPAVKKGRVVSPSACFSSISHYEVTIDGRKFIGSAQKRTGGVFLQHGSILTGFDREKLAGVLLNPGDLTSITSVNEHIRVGEGELIETLIAGFEEGLGITFQLKDLSEEESSLVQRYLGERYLSLEWNLRRERSSNV